ncbi:hypothetical protein VTN02DRAFT_2797 [Thermoascus thermophilus]
MTTATTIPPRSPSARTTFPQDGKKHLLLAASGSVATIKLPNIIGALAAHVPPSALAIRVIVTQSAQRFLAGQSPEQPPLQALRDSHPGVVEAIYTDASEWATPWTRGADVLHIELRRWADLLVIAPLSANTLAKMVHGLADNLLTSVVRAWDTTARIDGRRKHILVAPAMNTAMWLHPVTARQLRVLQDEWGAWVEVLPPQESKSLVCGDTGAGAMMEWSEIVRRIEERLGLTVPEGDASGAKP